jgi:hypothetical protein
MLSLFLLRTLAPLRERKNRSRMWLTPIRIGVDDVCILAQSGTHGHERRKRERFNITYSVTIKSSQSLVAGETWNVSPRGTLITWAYKEPLLPGTTSDLTIKRPSDSSSSCETSAGVISHTMRGLCQGQCHMLPWRSPGPIRRAWAREGVPHR